MAAKRNKKGQFVKGSTGNPNGRPPVAGSLTDVLRQKVDKEAIAELLIRAAEKGDPTLLRYIYDRLDGTPRQTLDIDQRGNMEMNMTIEFVDADS